MSSGGAPHYGVLWLVNCVEFVSLSGTFSYVTMFGHVEKAAEASWLIANAFQATVYL